MMSIYTLYAGVEYKLKYESRVASGHEDSTCPAIGGSH